MKKDQNSIKLIFGNIYLHLERLTFGYLFFSKHYPRHEVINLNMLKPFCSKYSSTRSHKLCYLKAMTVGLSVVIMYDTVHNFVWLTWHSFQSRTLISLGLFVTTTQRNIELLVHNLCAGNCDQEHRALIRLIHGGMQHWGDGTDSWGHAMGDAKLAGLGRWD